MKTYDLLVIGFGKAGKTLAAKMSSLGKKVALVEKDAQMYGGTCINVACIPTKTLIHAAEENLSFAQAMELKDTVTARLRQKNQATLTGSGVDLYTAKAKFLSNKVVELWSGDDREQLSADVIVINTGAVSNRLPIEGLAKSRNVYDSTGIQQLESQPQRLGIIGGGNIGLEFASLYANLGSQVTVFENSPMILGPTDEAVAQLAKSYLEEDGVSFVLAAQVEKVSNQDDAVLVKANGKTYEFDALLYATGRKPNVEDLGLENTDIQLTERGAVQVDDFCETSVENVYAVGDVHGGLQFTYTSLDDFRIVFGKLTGKGHYSLKERRNVPNTIFIQPPLSQVGLTEKEAQAAGLPYQSKELAVANMPRAHVNNDLRGLYKVVVHSETREILGASLFGQASQENINLIKMAMDNKIPYTYLKNQVFTHPTMAENLNDVFNF
ncbi:FAD-containing oxidoreductase [Streptococcus ratti]|uniref:Pyridine nucleotide-disulfide oxidoreductase n=1 Tax=Streptococcus ratti FA-1 = DSM 20564 TaxID=699248 RepID=A0ABN0GUI5_STRRT|nr:FAD-containing oxidoreductase [Streptococcus ratti]EJN94001.1 pyridine nucleotide-disulfide oxidoreductase [Streptococcus ratti FA-1 = DSM 20564]EMP69705.1 pyridine nucleotide-disulfide oxidoreductase [Streptococcus ratti FA-1 = DSM 20564]QEY07835.1 FAD-containing oxidoreductase [Streptococcus ratti]VEI60305.1 putative pyridine nucleotide-disulfide oxidoreductase YkgC [Streptococcus mutans]